jgi:uncharacterized protein YjiS (DUF1127 family)
MTEITAITARKAIGRSTAMPHAFGLLGRWIAGWRNRQQTRRDRTWLQSQPDYMLRDIGVSRREIDVILQRGRTR